MTILLKGGRVITGGKILPDKTDIFISGDRISAVGSFPNKGADQVIDLAGHNVTPGFIDVNTDSDHYLSLFSNPNQDDFLRQGVTTTIGGHCGSSLAPLIYGGLESIQKWVDVAGFNVNWHSMREYLEVLDKLKLGVNFGTLIGHSTVRRGIIGEEIRTLAKSELEVFMGILNRAMDEGGMGLSTGLTYVHSAKTPPHEIEFLVQAVVRQKGVHATHLRKEGKDLMSSINETAEVGRKTKAKIIISHFMPLYGFESEYESALKAIDSLRNEIEIYFDMYPYDISVLPLYKFLPDWARTSGKDAMIKNVQDVWFQRKILSDLPDIPGDVFVVARAGKNISMVGKSLLDLVKMYDARSTKEALLKLMVATRLNASVFFQNINPSLLRFGLKHPASLVASNAASFPKDSAEVMLKPERAVSTFTKFLNMVENRKLMPIEVAIRKITLDPALIFNLKGRGEIKEGYTADITAFKDNEIKLTIVNGAIAYREGRVTGERMGKALRHN